MGKRRILIVDDNLAFLETLTLYLSHCGYDVSNACSVSEALEILSLEFFDVVVTDLRLGQQRGESIVEYLSPSASVPNAVMIGMTACLAEAKDASRFSAVLEKPFALDALAGEIARHFPTDGFQG